MKHADRGPTDMKNIKEHFSSKAWVNSLAGLRGWGRGHFFSEYGHVAYQIKGNDACSNMVANILPLDYPSLGPLGMGQRGSKLNFYRTCSCCISN